MSTGAGWILGHPDTKMGWWHGATFKEDIRDELSIYSERMSKAMKKSFGFVNIVVGVYHDVTDTCVMTEYDNQGAAAA